MNILLLLVAASILFAVPVRVQANEKGANVRVGWYESHFNTMDGNGRRSGYAYEYQRKIAAYTGWEYTYVSGSWPDLMQMLMDGEIDLMSDVSYTEERAQSMLFSDFSMGTEGYCIFITPDNPTITPEDYSTLNGRRVGVNKGSVQLEIYLKWAEEHGVQADVVELTSTEVDSVDMLEAGKLDAFVTLNAYGDPRRLRPLCKIGASDFYFAVNRERPDLLEELNAAMSQIQDENPYYNQRMFERHMQSFGTNAFLTAAERSWLTDHGAVRVGYQDNYLAFCARDLETGQLTRHAERLSQLCLRMYGQRTYRF